MQKPTNRRIFVLSNKQTITTKSNIMKKVKIYQQGLQVNLSVNTLSEAINVVNEFLNGKNLNLTSEQKITMIAVFDGITPSLIISNDIPIFVQIFN